MKLGITREWFEKHIGDEDEGEVGAGLMAYAYDADRIIGELNVGRDPRIGFESYFDMGVAFIFPDLGGLPEGVLVHDFGHRSLDYNPSTFELTPIRQDAFIAANGGDPEFYSRLERGEHLGPEFLGAIHDRREDGDDSDDIAYEAAYQRRIEKAEDDLSDRLFAEDMAEDREKHTFRWGDSFYDVWCLLFNVAPENVRANYFEEELDGTWKCQVIDDQKHYAQCRGFQGRDVLERYLKDAGVRIAEDD